jgi:large subunit ribosomal protein L21
MTMYAVVSSGGKQYRVEAGSTLTLERLDGEPGASFTFDRVLLIGDGDDVTVGTPVVPGATVSATVLGQALGPKLVIFKFKQKVKYRRRTGHRQHLTRVRIDEIHPTAARKAAAPVQKAAQSPEAKAKPKAAPTTAKPKAAPTTAKPKAAPTTAKPKAAPTTAKPKAAPTTAKPRAAATAANAAAPKARRTAKAKAKE